jgi:lathosterol oxidase
MFSIVIVAALVVILAERTRLVRRRLPFLRANFLGDVAFLLVSWIAIAKLTLRWVMYATDAVGLTWLDGIPLWLETVLALVFLDLGNYLGHWLMHRYEPLWRVHAVHHSSPALDWLATFRSHLLEQLLRRVTAPLLLIACGVSPAAAAIAGGILIAWGGVFVHSNLALNLRFLEPILITPRLHHLHHVAASADQNLGTLLSVWDRLLGRLVVHDVPRDTLLGNGAPAYPQTFGRLIVEPFRPRSSVDNPENWRVLNGS